MLSFLFRDKSRMVAADQALAGRSSPAFPRPEPHFVLGTSLSAVPAGAEVAIFGLGCFWGAERKFWQLEGVISTSVGYAGGFTPNPTYEEVCSGRTGHTEVVRVVFDPTRISYEQLVATFFESHDPTQGMRQGHDVGTQYRSAILATSEAQREAAERIKAAYAGRLRAAGHDAVTTEIAPAGECWLAEDHHQQYLAKNPGGYCGIGGTGVSCPVGRGDGT